MQKSNLYSKLLKSPDDAPVFISDKLEVDFIPFAYSLGLFPWTSNPVTWWCPSPRMILLPDQIHIQKSIKKALKNYKIKLDQNFCDLIKLCALRKKTWISKEFITIYTQLFEKNIAHSVEVYENDELIGGLYGLIIGKVFFGESMISLKKDASKTALIKLCEILKPYDFIIDCQVPNEHLKFMGAKEIYKKDFLKILEQKVTFESGFENFKNLL
ncbi:leucyl/phenylalanyl-tRNA--protein transferase [Campylobacter volucris]|uniref:Leucyl/phenylalanyl-tRNA--protein transferase n=2 Tax=Campylobacter volucris TaxID=1031542 RepID=A0AAE5YHB1_9BACT|nr:leucyl/phenylalanyl-tRNA--protein transferase [Campylobacter volucris]AJC94342.1 leucyl, phenylalanyl-tRNA-protein transferase [Campylobacter volucris LMG 24379]KAB0580492.1 leucyl/phenylalanyl-tRNA--protein transferase [Campylobacter volucris]MBF7045155.1 leucyl/phenylalanyl-tRNA--protein transferase [Campylobacter volucris]QBL13296.1 leucyl/phenylalanyl-tRNA--protein transferase [Campylobacter volucris]QEL08558.1 leucyl, phenylalanyl-tRNA-protein transferase [Campylobacter volucris]